MLIYTFRTYPHRNLIQNLGGDIFVFSQLKSDLEKFTYIINCIQPDLVLGIADSKSGSRIEPIAINKFNHGLVLKNGPARLPLFIPQSVDFQIASSPTHSFCNWTMYRVQHFITRHNPAIKHTFFHLDIKDIEKLNCWIAATIESGD